MKWATTVVKLRRDGARANVLSDDLSDFPAEFLLFSKHVGSLRIIDQTKDRDRTVMQAVDADGGIELLDGDKASRWRLFKAVHRPSGEARKDGGTIAARETVPVWWAVPLGGRTSPGRFWAFFPTTQETTLSGIVNAPWKTNADRQGLLPAGRTL